MSTFNSDEDGAATPKGYKLTPSRNTFRFASSNLGLTQNPVAKNGDGEHLLHPSHAEVEEPPPVKEDEKGSLLQFHKREGASTSELFYDLWFVANLNVFATAHPIIDKKNLVTFISYFILLWITWLVTTVYDARFSQDGVMARLARACHLGVMIGFAVTGVSFGQEGIVPPIFTAMSFCLMSSRAVLSAQYALVLYHARDHKRTRKTVILAIVLHLLPAGSYLMCALIKIENMDNRLLGVWYAIGFFEMAAVIMHSMLSKTLSFEGTHFNERLNLLTLIILGEGVIILSKNITKIVQYTWIKDITTSWSPALCGMIVCGASIIYIIFQLYFDWMHHHHSMKAINQVLWTVIHLPFHIVLVLLSEGSSQWVLWWRVMESFHSAEKKLVATVQNVAAGSKTADVVMALNATAQEILYTYGSDIAKKGGDSAEDFESTLEDLLTIPDSYWGTALNTSSATYQTFHKKFITISSIVVDAISNAYGLSYEEDTGKSKSQAQEDADIDTAALNNVLQTTSRLVLIFIYVFLCAGLVIILLMVMHLISKRRGWSPFNILRTGVVFTIGVVIGFVALIATNSSLTSRFILTPWPLPIITIALAIVLIITHLPHPPHIFIDAPKDESVEMDHISTQQQEGIAQGPTRKQSLKRRLSTMHQTAKHIRFRAGAFDPVSESEQTLERKAISSHNLYRT